MKDIVKRVLALVLSLALCVGMVPLTSSAAEEEASTGFVDTGNMTVEGTNGFGAMLADDIQQSESEVQEAYEAGYSVTALEIVDGVATVTYDTLEDANLVVAIYSEDGKKLITSGKTEVSKDDTLAVVTIEGDVPTYFYAEAFLLDTYDFSPLCVSYDTPMYTKEMQDLLASTTADYDEELVYNLDEDETTNFAVYHENVIRIPYVEGVNTVVSTDDGTMVYVIENADEHFTALQQGDIFAYEYGEEDLLIAKVDTLTVEGTTVTIVGASIEMEEVFAVMKLEGDSATNESTVDMSNAAHFVEYKGLVKDEVQTFASEDSGSDTVYHEFGISLSAEEAKKDLNVSVSLGISVHLEIESGFRYYISWDERFLEMHVTPRITTGIEISGEIQTEIPMGYLGMIPCPGVIIGMEPKLVFGFSGPISAKIETSMTFGVKYDGELHNLTTSPQTDVFVEAEVEITFGVDWAPYIAAISEETVKIQLEVFTGFSATVTTEVSGMDSLDKNPSSMHACENCLSIELSFKAELNGNIKFFNSDWKWLNITINFGTWTVPLGSLYYSVDYDDFGIGECPYKSYKITFVVSEDKDAKNGIKDAVLTAINENGEKFNIGKTNRKGIVREYLSQGTYTVSAVIDGDTYQMSYRITESCRQMFYKNHAQKTLFDGISSEKLVDHGEIQYHGTCGEEITWCLYEDGFFGVYGKGVMGDESSWNDVPWYPYRKQIKMVGISEGITGLQNGAFKYCDNLVKVSLPNTLTNINYGAFANCTSLTSITIPSSVTSIGDDAFANCTSLTSITIPGSVTSIGAYAFGWCSSLTSVTILDGVTNIGIGAFYDCTALTSVTILDGVTSIGHYAFEDCTALTEITLPDSLISIGVSTFYYCSSLTSITIPNSVTNIGYGSFAGCSSLISITIPDGVTQIGDYMFRGCSSLRSVTIPHSVSRIGWTAFLRCNSLKNVYYTGSQAQWNAIAIDSDNEELRSATKHYNYVVSSPLYNAVYGGDVVTVQPSDGEVYKTVSFDGLAVGRQYTLLVLVTTATDDVLSGSNVLYIKQGVSDESGKLVFEYVLREGADTSYVMACGASEKDLTNASITYPTMVGLDEEQAVDPTVVYEGEVLTEGVDYVVVGTVDYTAADTYTCYIRGIYDYTGLATCTYTVCEKMQTETAIYAVTSKTTVTLMDDLSDGAALFVPATVDGKIVTAIADDAVSDTSLFIVFGGDAATWETMAMPQMNMTVYFARTADGTLVGDLNGDDAVDTADMRAALLRVLDDDADTALLDANADGNVDSRDIRGMLRVLAYA